MPSKTPPVSLRFPPGLRPLVQAYADERAIKLHAAIILLLKAGVAQGTSPVTTPSPKAVLAQAEAKAAHLGVLKPRRRVWNLKSVQLGPTEPPLGSRLKGTTPGKAKR